MKTRILAALSATALAVTLTACTSEPEPTQSDASPTPVETTVASPEPTAPVVSGELRPLPEGLTEEAVATGVRSLVPTWPEELSDAETVAILNAGCDGLDATGNPDGGVQAIAAYGIAPADAAFALLAAISSYCPEYSALLGGAA